MLERTRYRKKLILAQPRDSEILKSSNGQVEIRGDVTARPIQEPFEYLKNGVSAKSYEEKFVNDRGEISEKQRKRKIPYDKPQEIPAILQLSKQGTVNLAVKWPSGAPR